MEIEERFIKEIVKSRVEIEENNLFGEVEDVFLNIIKEIYERKNRMCLKGK